MMISHFIQISIDYLPYLPDADMQKSQISYYIIRLLGFEIEKF